MFFRSLLKDGKYISFGYPAAVFTGGAGINKLGQVVGEYQLADYVWHGFITSPITARDFECTGCLSAIETGR